MKYADYYDCDICNGTQVGMSLFVSGCPFHCKECFNSEIWDYNAGKDWTPEIEDKFLDLVGRDYIHRVTFVGGSPMCDENVRDVYYLIRRIREMYPDKKIWVYTGYTFEEIYKPEFWQSLYIMEPDPDDYRNAILKYIDVLVDGRYECDKRDLSLGFVGSSNQRIIDIPKTLEQGEICLKLETSSTMQEY